MAQTPAATATTAAKAETAKVAAKAETKVAEVKADAKQQRLSLRLLLHPPARKRM
jgi:hypothetical protein